jgi:hypothetical protein
MVDPCWARVRGPLAPYVDGFRVELARLGYTPLTAAGHVRLVAHLSRWMLLLDLSVDELTPPVVASYFEERRAAGYVNSVTPRALRLSCPVVSGHPAICSFRRLLASCSTRPGLLAASGTRAGNATCENCRTARCIAQSASQHMPAWDTPHGSRVQL